MEQGSVFRLRYFVACKTTKGRSHWLRGPRRGSAAARLLGFQVRNPPGSWIYVPCEYCVLTGILCDGLITRPEESYRVWCLRV